MEVTTSPCRSYSLSGMIPAVTYCCSKRVIYGVNSTLRTAVFSINYMSAAYMERGFSQYSSTGRYTKNPETIATFVPPFLCLTPLWIHFSDAHQQDKCIHCTVLYQAGSSIPHVDTPKNPPGRLLLEAKEKPFLPPSQRAVSLVQSSSPASKVPLGIVCTS